MTLNQNILILSAGRRVDLVRHFQEALRQHFPAAHVYTADARPELSAACHVSSGAFTVPRASDPAYVDALLNLCRQQRIGLVVPTIDTELAVLARSRSQFDDVGTHVVISSAELVGACRDKRRTAELFTSLSIDQPRIYSRDAITFPCFCKPYDGSRSIGARAILNQSMLTQELLSDDKNMFMELIGKDHSEFTIDAYYNRHGKLCCVVPRERIEVRDGEVSKGATRRNGVYDYLLEKLAGLQGAEGCITVQVFSNTATGSLKALEINPRFGGGYPLSYAAGANFPKWLIQEYLLGEEIGFMDTWESDLLMLRYDAKVLVRDNTASRTPHHEYLIASA